MSPPLWVVDASFAAGLFLPDENSEAALALIAEARAGRAALVTTALWPHEMANLMLSAVRRHRIPAAKLPDAARLLHALPIRIEPPDTEASWGDMTKLAVEAGLTAYDAGYLALALARKAGLATHDGDLLKAAKAKHLPVWPSR